MQIVYYKCVKFHKNPISGLGGVALTRYMDGRTDRVIPIYPPNFVCGGYKKECQHKHEQYNMQNVAESMNIRRLPTTCYVGRICWLRPL